MSGTTLLGLPHRVWLGALAIFALRAALILAFGPDVSPDLADHPVYHKNALKLLQGWEMWATPGSEFGYRAPLFFAYVAGVLGLFGTESYQVSQLFTALLASIDCVLLFVLTRAVAGEKAGYIAFWLRGFLPNFVFADTYVLSEHMFAIFMLSALIIVARHMREPSLRHAVALGVLLGLSMLTREAGIVFPALFFIYLAFSHGTLGKRAAKIATCAAAIALVTAPWMLRNEFVWGQPLPLSYTAGPGLYNGNNPNFTGEGIMPAMPEGVSLKFGTPEYERWHREQAIAYIVADPIGFFERMPIKVAWFLWPRFQRFDISVVYPTLGAAATPLSILIGASSALILLAGVAAFLTRPLGSWWWVSLGVIAVIGAAILVTGGDPRYRDPIDYVFLAAIGATLAAGARNLRSALSSLWMEKWRGTLALVAYVSIGASWLWVALFKSAQ